MNFPVLNTLNEIINFVILLLEGPFRNTPYHALCLCLKIMPTGEEKMCIHIISMYSRGKTFPGCGPISE
jgi:hypothetical protein